MGYLTEEQERCLVDAYADKNMTISCVGRKYKAWFTGNRTVVIRKILNKYRVKRKTASEVAKIAHRKYH